MTRGDFMEFGYFTFFQYNFLILSPSLTFTMQKIQNIARKYHTSVPRWVSRTESGGLNLENVETMKMGREQAEKIGAPKRPPSTHPGGVLHQQGPVEKIWLAKQMWPLYPLFFFVASGLTLGVWTSYRQLVVTPETLLKKSRRETIAELDDPEQIEKEAHAYVESSLLRKLAHLAGYERYHHIEDANSIPKTPEGEYYVGEKPSPRPKPLGGGY